MTQRHEQLISDYDSGARTCQDLFAKTPPQAKRRSSIKKPKTYGADILARAKEAAQAKRKGSPKEKPVHVNPTDRSHEIAVNQHLKRANYPPEIVKIVMGLRAASYKMGGTDLAYLFGKIDTDKSGSLDAAEFKRVLRRCVCFGAECVY